jgi:hypothetical protein
MATFMKRLFLSSAAGVTMFTFLPQAWAGGRMGMMAVRPPMMMAPNMVGRMTTGTMMNGGMMNGGMMNSGMNGMRNGTMTGAMTNGNMMNSTMGTPFGFPNGFGGFGNQPFGFPGSMSPWWSGLGGYGGYGGGYGGYGLGGYGWDSLYANPNPSTDTSSTSTKKKQKREPIPTLTPEQERELRHQEILSWSRSKLPENETTSATALNILLEDLQRFQNLKGQAGQTKLDPAMLASINVVVAGTNGNIGVLKHDARIHWTSTLREPEFESDRQRIESAIAKALEEATTSKLVDVRDLTSALTKMRNHLAGKIQEISDPDYIRAKRLLNSLDDVVKVLGEPDAGNYFNQIYAAKGQTVAQLVQHMTRSNLRFAPAVPGDEAAYLFLHRALAEYDLALHSQAVAKK